MYTGVSAPATVNCFMGWKLLAFLTLTMKVTFLFCTVSTYQESRKSLRQFMIAWNNHPLQTEHNWSPRKIWVNSVIQSDLNDTSCPGEDYGVDPTGRLSDEELATVVIPKAVHPLSDAQLSTFMDKVNSESTFEDFGVSLFVECKATFQ